MLYCIQIILFRNKFINIFRNAANTCKICMHKGKLVYSLLQTVEGRGNLNITKKEINIQKMTYKSSSFMEKRQLNKVKTNYRNNTQGKVCTIHATEGL